MTGANGTFELHIISMNNNTLPFTITVGPSDTVGSIYPAIEAQTGIAEPQQNYEETNMSDPTRTFAQYAIYNGPVTLMLRQLEMPSTVTSY